MFTRHKKAVGFSQFPKALLTTMGARSAHLNVSVG